MVKKFRRDFSLAYDLNVPASQTDYTKLVGVKVPKGRVWTVIAVGIRISSGSANKVKIDIIKDPNGDILLPNNIGSANITSYEASSVMDGYTGDAVTWSNYFGKDSSILFMEDEEIVLRGKNSDTSAHKASANITILEEEIYDE